MNEAEKLVSLRKELEELKSLFNQKSKEYDDKLQSFTPKDFWELRLRTNIFDLNDKYIRIKVVLKYGGKKCYIAHIDRVELDTKSCLHISPLKLFCKECFICGDEYKKRVHFATDCCIELFDNDDIIEFENVYGNEFNNEFEVMKNLHKYFSSYYEG